MSAGLRLGCAICLALSLFARASLGLIGTLAVQASQSAVTASLDAIGVDTQSLAVTGNVTVDLAVATHPSFGVVAVSGAVTGGELAIGDATFAPAFGSHVAISAVAQGLRATPEGVAASAVPTAAGTSHVDLAGFGLRIDLGTVGFSGFALGGPVSESWNFAAQPGELRASAGTLATVTTQGPAGGPLAVTISVPASAFLLALDAPMHVPLTLEGQIVLAGVVAAATDVPAVGWLGSALTALAFALLASALLARLPRTR